MFRNMLSIKLLRALNTDNPAAWKDSLDDLAVYAMMWRSTGYIDGATAVQND